MNFARFCGATIATLSLVAPTVLHAEEGTTVRLDTVQKLWVNGDKLGPLKDGLPRVGQNTGAGVMDTNFAFDNTSRARASAGTEVILGTTYTRSDSQINPNSDNSYMQGGFALARLHETRGLELGPAINLPRLAGDRAFMRPLIQFAQGGMRTYVVLVAASEDNNSANGNPKPVLYLAELNRATMSAQLVKIANNTRGDVLDKPTDLVEQALRDGIAVDNPDNQRGPHMIVPVSDNSFLVGTQYNNRAQEVFRFTVSETNGNPEVHVNWGHRYSDNAVHNRPQVAYTQGAAEGYMTAVECNAQPANIGIRLTKFNVANGETITSKIVVKADPDNNKYVAEPSIADMGDSVAVGFAYSAKARDRDGGNGHAGGANVSQLALYKKTDLSMVGDMLATPANYQRHAHIFGTSYGPGTSRAVGVISGSSTGTSKGLLQVVPLKADGTLGLKDPLKMYTVSTYSDVANLPARGKRNPNNQAKGFINGLGDIPNPGFDKPGGFYTEVRTFTMSTVAGYSTVEARDIGRRESAWLSLVPSTWAAGLTTVPGVPNENAGIGPAPRVAGDATDPNGEAGGNGSVIGGEATGPNGARDRGDWVSADSCAASGRAGTPTTALFVLGLGVVAAVRRRREREAA